MASQMKEILLYLQSKATSTNLQLYSLDKENVSENSFSSPAESF